jgi:hypothetical protein
MYGGFKSLIPPAILDGYEVHEWRNATAILNTVFPGEWADVLDVLGSIRLAKSFIATGGGNKSNVSKTIDKALYSRGWVEKKFETAIMLDGKRTDSPTHKIDCYKNTVGLEIEWNNKDPFFDRDLNNFRLLFELRALAVGIIVTRCDELQDIFDELGRGSSYGESTTHMSKLLPKVEGGGAGGCPTLVFGIRRALYDPNS